MGCIIKHSHMHFVIKDQGYFHISFLLESEVHEG